MHKDKYQYKIDLDKKQLSSEDGTETLAVKVVHEVLLAMHLVPPCSKQKKISVSSDPDKLYAQLFFPDCSPRQTKITEIER